MSDWPMPALTSGLFWWGAIAATTGIVMWAVSAMNRSTEKRMEEWRIETYRQERTEETRRAAARYDQLYGHKHNGRKYGDPAPPRIPGPRRNTTPGSDSSTGWNPATTAMDSGGCDGGGDGGGGGD